MELETEGLELVNRRNPSSSMTGGKRKGSLESAAAESPRKEESGVQQRLTDAERGTGLFSVLTTKA